MNRTISTFLGVVLAVFTPLAHGQSQQADLQTKLNTLFKLTQMTADGTDVVAPGTSVGLHLDGLQMCSIQAKFPLINEYKDGKIFSDKLSWKITMDIGQSDLPPDTVPLRQFVPGEKFWISAITAEKHGVLIKFYSDYYGDTRYYGELEFPLNKKAMPTPDEILKMVADVVIAVPASEEVQTAPSTPSTPAPVAAIPPPPPAVAPQAAPKTISLGMAKEMVVFVLGQPGKVANIGPKEIDYYPDMKVIFVNGKVTDIQ